MSRIKKARSKIEKQPVADVSGPVTREQRVLIYAPTGNDSRLTADFLRKVGISAEINGDVSELCDEVRQGCGAILLAEEALGTSAISYLIDALAHQPPWSDIPVIIITSGGEANQVRLRRLAIFGPSGNVTLLERPFRPGTLVSAAETALRARQRQYDSRNLMAELSDARARIEATLAAADVGTWVWDILNNRVVADKNLARLFSLALKNLSSGTLQEFLNGIHPDDRNRVESAIAEALKDPKGELEVDYRVPLRDGSLRWVTARGKVERDARRKPIRFSGVVIDITDRKSQQETLGKLSQRIEDQWRVFNTTLSYINDFAYIFDRKGRFLYANKPLLDLWGLSLDEAVGKNFFDLKYPEELATKLQRQIQEVIETKKPVRDETPYTSLTGDGGYYEYIFNPVLSADGSVELVAGSTRDITESKKAEEAARRLAAIVESSEDAIISKDLNSIITSWNQGAERLFGYKAEEVIGKPITILMPEELVNEEPNILLRIRKGERVDHYETIRRRKDGSHLEISLTVSPIKDANGKIIGASKIVRDITDQKRAERELERAHKETLAASQAKDNFLAALSHELRTPLNPVLLLASEAAEDPELPAKVRAQFTTIRNNVELEARLIDDLLDITRITHGKLALSPSLVDVHALFNEAIVIVRAELDLKRITLAMEMEANEHTVKGDGVRLQQVFWNVLKNAVKFTPAGGKITVKTATRSETREFIVEVIDSGIGMTDSELARIFEAFSQGEHARAGGSHRFGGLGLGLAISRMLIEAHSGSIRASSEGQGRGSTFTITLPLATKSKGAVERPEGDSRASQEAINGGAKGVRVLLVEDHEPTRTALAHLLARRHYDVKTAASVAEARTVSENHEFELLISDIGLPDGNGFELMKELRARKKDLKGIALTGYGMQEDIERTHAAGFTSHLTKPVRVQSLEAALAEVASH